MRRRCLSQWRSMRETSCARSALQGEVGHPSTQQPKRLLPMCRWSWSWIARLAYHLLASAAWLLAVLSH